MIPMEAIVYFRSVSHNKYILGDFFKSDFFDQYVVTTEITPFGGEYQSTTNWVIHYRLGLLLEMLESTPPNLTCIAT